MILYTDNAGRWAGTQADAKRDFGIKGIPLQTEVPTDKTGLLTFLNDRCVQTGWIATVSTPFIAAPTTVYRARIVGTPPTPDVDLGFDDEASDALDTVTAPYQSPLNARTVLAGIDSGMCASAIRQMDGANLARIVTAAIERLAELNR